MSETISTTVKSTNLKHASASGNNVVLDSSGNTSLSGNLAVTGTTTLTGAVELPDDTVDIADLSATGTASSSTYLRGDNSWATPAGYTGVATLKAWAAFDGDGDVNATLTGGNITSLTDHGTGSYTITFDTDFADDNYMMAGSQATNGFVGFDSEANIQAGSCKIGTLTDGGGMHDSFRTTVGFWR